MNRKMISLQIIFSPPPLLLKTLCSYTTFLWHWQRSPSRKLENFVTILSTSHPSRFPEELGALHLPETLAG